MRKELGDHAENQQSRQSREQIHSGSLKMKQIENVALPLKQHTEYPLAVQIVREREQKQRVAGCNSMQEEEQQAQPSSSSWSQWDDWWTSSW